MSSLTKLLQEKRKNERSDSKSKDNRPSATSIQLESGFDRNATAHNSTTSITTVTQIESDESPTLSSSFGGHGHFPSSFLNVNSAHTATMYGSSVQGRDRSGSMYIDTAVVSGTSYSSSYGNAARSMRVATPSSSHLGGTKHVASLSSSIPYAVPNSNKNTGTGLGSNNSSFGSSWTENFGNSMPSNISAIDSNVISSPKVDSVEPRFVISKQKFQKSSMDNAAQASSLSRTNSLTSQFGSLFFSKGSKDTQSSATATFTSPTNAKAASSSSIAAATAIPKPGRARQSSIYSSSRQPSGSFTDNYLDCSSVGHETQPSQSVPRSRHASVANLKSFFKKGSSTNIAGSVGTFGSPGAPPIAVPYSSRGSANSAFTPSSYGSNNGDTIYSHTNDTSLPFAKRYTKTGEDLGAGAGGSVKLVRRIADNKVFAVKEFRAKFDSETKRDYVKKITSEYCIGSTLRHQNIIETIEIVYDNNRILQVMEYCEYDLFAIVMSNKMSYEETCCCFKQILSGVEYLHGLGLAHRDLKLDNCVINEKGIVKLIDFGAAVVFSYPFSKILVEASGIVGSDPYLAPEVCIFSKYDPRPVDIWSVAIIFACMILKKFPWKIPKLRDNSFKLFCSGRDCDSLSALVTRTPDPPSYDHSETPSTSNNSPEKKHTNNPADPGNPNIGPQRLYHSLPEECQHIISRMVDLAPACRASIEEVMEDPWVSGIDACHMEESGLTFKVVNGTDHTHTKVDQSEAHIAGLERKKKKQGKAAPSSS
ncbi:hypothetical protein HG537_0C00870 [Torulaspora globosa]|uniref:non-specific serine/threonine protein kinase n=1 Tax=Torulaspora globosa TaxID=48254 RepID=A0A7H9HQ08_9SACH|nr:hypothetical protein HG537_0C00870 [Torulaspora sp. CBS 2947]